MLLFCALVISWTFLYGIRFFVPTYVTRSTTVDIYRPKILAYGHSRLDLVHIKSRRSSLVSPDQVDIIYNQTRTNYWNQNGRNPFAFLTAMGSPCAHYGSKKAWRKFQASSNFSFVPTVSLSGHLMLRIRSTPGSTAPVGRGL